MNHYRFDAAKYERRIAQFRTNADRIGQLLQAIGSFARATRAVREAVDDGRMPAATLGTQEAIVKFIAEQHAPDTLQRRDPAVEVDEELLNEMIDLLLKNFELLRFGDFVVPPGGEPEVMP